MKVAPGMINRYRLFLLLLFLLAPPLFHLVGLPEHALAQGDEPGARLTITQIDERDFPLLTLHFIATDEESRPLNDLTALRLRENGVPVVDFTLDEVLVGFDVTFVLDARPDFMTAAVGGDSGIQQVRDSLLRFSGRYMTPGQDRVTLIAPTAEGATFLLEDSTDPVALLNAIAAYEPPAEESTALGRMLALAVQEAAADTVAGAVIDGTEGAPAALTADERFQAIVLFTDGVALPSASLRDVAEQAQEAGTPIFVVLVGGSAPESAPRIAEDLTEPTRGITVPLADPSAADELYNIFEANSSQHRLQYTSYLQSSGRYPIRIYLEEAQAERILELHLAPPEIAVRLEEETIRRVGAAPDTPLRRLQPAVVTVPVEVDWADDTARELAGATLQLDGRVQEAVVVGGGERLFFEWDVSMLDAGQYELVARITDTLGLRASSPPVSLMIETALPAPSPTATPAPSPATPLAVSAPEPTLVLGLALALLLTTVLWLRFRYAPARRSRPAPAPDPTLLPPEEDVDEAPEHQEVEREGAVPDAFLVVPAADDEEAGRIPLMGSNITIGRSREGVDLVLGDRSVSPLHARLRRRGGDYWLYDEGSASGTFVNFERLGLAPRRLEEGDEILFGRLRARFSRRNP